VSGEEPGGGRPTLRIVRGDPTAEELAALVAVLTSASGEEHVEQAPLEARSRWASPERMMRPALAPTGWWASSLPR
jgi:hypothetical protein